MSNQFSMPEAAPSPVLVLGLDLSFVSPFLLHFAGCFHEPAKNIGQRYASVSCSLIRQRRQEFMPSHPCKRWPDDLLAKRRPGLCHFAHDLIPCRVEYSRSRFGSSYGWREQWTSQSAGSDLQSARNGSRFLTCFRRGPVFRVLHRLSRH